MVCPLKSKLPTWMSSSIWTTCGFDKIRTIATILSTYVPRTALTLLPTLFHSVSTDPILGPLYTRFCVLWVMNDEYLNQTSCSGIWIKQKTNLGGRINSGLLDIRSKGEADVKCAVHISTSGKWVGGGVLHQAVGYKRSSFDRNDDCTFGHYEFEMLPWCIIKSWMSTKQMAIWM